MNNGERKKYFAMAIQGMLKKKMMKRNDITIINMKTPATFNVDIAVGVCKVHCVIESLHIKDM